ncbi:MAG: nucleotidyltransferase domain-containing protein [Selenomonadaceae bacterium]|nr:nucleotidyltransferase domain-containing protein [Selenomonadaceae bacterium]
MSLFGSYARGEADEKSDVDIFINLGKIRGLDYFGFLADVEDELECSVDIVTTGTKNSELLGEIKKDEVLLYER